MNIIDILDKKSCRTGITATSKSEVIEMLADMAMASSACEGVKRETIFNAIRDREAQGSTAFGNEIAIPHARIDGMKEFLLCVATSTKGVDFEALDRKKAKVLFLILGPAEGVNDHLKILATVSRALSHTDLKRELGAARTETAAYEAVIRNTAADRSSHAQTRVMKLVLINLYVEDYLYRILELLIEEGIEGATIMESAGMGQYISNVPLFADFIGFMNESKHKSKTIMTLVPEEHVDDLISGIEDVTGDLDKKQGAMILVLDVAHHRGSMKMM